MTPQQYNLIGSGIQGLGGIGSTIIANEYNKREAQRARDWSEEMWHKQNEYNLPANQMIRLKEAGINPNLAFGSAASAMGASVPSVPDSPRSGDFGRGLNTAIEGYFSRKFEEKRLTSLMNFQFEQARKLRLDNDTTELLLDDYRGMKRSEYALNTLKNQVDQSLYGRQRNLDIDLLSAKWLNELDKYFAHVPAALASHYRAQDALLNYKTLNEFESYLTNKAKGKYERKFYNNYLNPYETSTVAGLLRTLLGTGFNLNEETKSNKGPNNGIKLKRGLRQALDEAAAYPSMQSFFKDLWRAFKDSFRYPSNGKSFRW